jgi:hypothetical protein
MFDSIGRDQDHIGDCIVVSNYELSQQTQVSRNGNEKTNRRM